MAKGAIYTINTDAVSGSFSKIQIGGGNFGCAKFTNIQFGIGLLANDNGSNIILNPYKHFNTVIDVEISGSATIEGPISGFKLANGSVLAYL
jgi:hypothetical protein